MINLQVDEGYAFDYLSILEVKNSHINNQQTKKNLEDCSNLLKVQLGDIFFKIIESEEYKNLIRANNNSFLIIDRVRDGEKVSAKEVDALNTQRFTHKKNLQRLFFNNDVQECKN